MRRLLALWLLNLSEASLRWSVIVGTGSGPLVEHVRDLQQRERVAGCTDMTHIHPADPPHRKP